MQRRVVILIILIFLLLGCTWTKQFLSRNGDSGDHTTIPIDPNELLEMAYYCDEAYAKATPENKLYEIAGANKNNKDEFSYHVKQDSGVTILIFRGTSNRDNVLTDIDFRPFKDGALSRHHRIDLYLHRGFRDASMFLYEDIKANYPLEKTVYLTGHSLGGAIAQIIGLWLDMEGYNVQIYTFGSPKVTTTFFGTKPAHYRVVVDNDPIPFLPIYPYVHSGIRIDVETLRWWEYDEYGKFTEIDGRDHSITYYLRTLSKHVRPTTN
tara:strand:- start:484 stop:1281 length:798 start_codon:yes stop_codon:yes gene_type:complete